VTYVVFVTDVSPLDRYVSLGLEYEAKVLYLGLGLGTEGQVLGLIGLAEYLVLKFRGHGQWDLQNT